MKILLIRTIAVEEDCNRALYNNQGIGLATELSKMGHECGLVYYAKRGNARTETIDSEGIKLKVYHITGKNLVWNAIYDCELYRICAEYDIIQTSECDQICSWQVYKRFPEKTVIYHGPYKSQYTKKYNMRSTVFDMVFLWRADFKNAKVITKSYLAERYLKNKGFKNVTTLGVGLNPYVLKQPIDGLPQKLEQVIENKKNDKYLLYVGALSKRKNLKFLLQVFNNLVKKRRHNNYKLIIVGDKAYKEEKYFNSCFDYITEKDLTNNVIYLGTLEQKYLRFLYEISDLYLLATQYDIFGMVYLEAMYFGTPILTTECGGSSLLIEDGKTGYIQKLGDLNAWSETAEEILENSKKNQHIRECAKQFLQEKYLWSQLAPKFWEVYDEVISRK